MTGQVESPASQTNPEPSPDRLRELYRDGGTRELASAARRFAHYRTRKYLTLPFGRFVLGPLARRHYRPTSVNALDWDNLIILDGARFDHFEAVAGPDHTPMPIHSVGSSSPEFVRQTIDARYSDHVLVTANPYYEWTGRHDCFADARLLYHDRWEDGTVKPETVVDQARLSAYRNPDRKHVVHFLQPHKPFITGHLADHRGTEYDALERGAVEPDEFERAYRANLQLAFDEALKLARTLDGRTVITADHGESFGEPGLFTRRPLFEHPEYRYNDALVRVPWLPVGDAEEGGSA